MVLIFDPDQKAEEKKKILGKIKDWLGDKGKVVRQESWGTRTLAYPLKTGKGKELQEGEYFQIDFEAEAGSVAEIDKKLRLEEKIVRSLIVSKPKAKGGERVSGKKFK